MRIHANGCPNGKRGADAVDCNCRKNRGHAPGCWTPTNHVVCRCGAKDAKVGHPRVHREACNNRMRYGCNCKPAETQPPIVCACRKDDDGRRWLSLGCRLHTRIWSPGWNYDRRRSDALSGADLCAPTRKPRAE